MGGFVSSFETAASSGANSTFSGVPVGNSVGGDGGGFAPASSTPTPTSFALPETCSGGDWTGQAFAPSAMTQPLPEPGLPETSDWKPRQVPETPSSNLLENYSSKSAAGSGLLAKTPLLAKTGESEGLRKANPILSKLAAEHPENPVHLKGGLLGALPTQPQPVKPPNPFAHKDELPKLPKIDWGAYDKHRIEAAPSLLGTARPNRFADPDFEKSYWQSAEAYKAEFERKQQMPMTTEVPRPGDPGRRGVISTNPENPAYPDRGNFAEKLWGRQSESQDRQVPDLSADQKATRDTLLRVRTQGKNFGYENSSRMLDHYLNGNGEPVTLDKDWVRQHPPVQEGEAKSQKHFEEWLTGVRGDKSGFGNVKEWLASGKPTLEVKGMEWEGAGNNPVWKMDDKSNTLGALKVVGSGDLRLERKGNDVFVTGTVNQRGFDNYDFDKKDRTNEWLPQGILGGDVTMIRQQITDMEKAGGAKTFEIQTAPWTKTLEGRLKLDDQGNITSSQFVWKEVPSSDKMRR